MTLHEELDAAESLSAQMAGGTAVMRKGPGMAETAATLISASLAAVLVAN